MKELVNLHRTSSVYLYLFPVFLTESKDLFLNCSLLTDISRKLFTVTITFISLFRLFLFLKFNNSIRIFCDGKILIISLFYLVKSHFFQFIFYCQLSNYLQIQFNISSRNLSILFLRGSLGSTIFFIFFILILVIFN